MNQFQVVKSCGYIAMDKLLLCVLVAVVGPCLCMKSWELPQDDLLGYVSPGLHENWISYKKVFNKTYSTTREEITRRLYWEDNFRFIQEHNKKFDNGEVTFTVGENDMADMSEDEVKQVYLSGLIIPEVEPEAPVFLGENITETPLEVDWRQNGLVTPVKNQGRCGSCWTFSAVAALEGGHKKKTGQLLGLSEQNLLDCSRAGNYGCRGGWMNNAFNYVRGNGGIDKEDCYPYEGYQKSCRYRSSCKGDSISGYTNVGKSERYLEKACSSVGPLAIAVDVNHRSFMYYRGGVYYEPACRPNIPPTHAMALVGYGGTGSNAYWTVKNSWGTRWGQQGYIYMARNRQMNCRIADFASYPN